MLALYIVFGIIGFLLLLLLIPLHANITFDKDLNIKARYGFLTVIVWPRPKKTPKKKVKKEKVKEVKEPEEKKMSAIEEMLKTDGLGAVLSFIKQLIKISTRAAKRTFRAFTIKHLNLNIIVASDDAADTALNYGKMCAAVYPASGVLHSLVRIKKSDINISPSFLTTTSTVFFDIRLKVVPLRLIWMGLRFLASFVVTMVKLFLKDEDKSEQNTSESIS